MVPAGKGWVRLSHGGQEQLQAPTFRGSPGQHRVSLRTRPQRPLLCSYAAALHGRREARPIRISGSVKGRFFSPAQGLPVENLLALLVGHNHGCAYGRRALRRSWDVFNVFEHLFLHAKTQQSGEDCVTSLLICRKSARSRNRADVYPCLRLSGVGKADCDNQRRNLVMVMDVLQAKRQARRL